MIDSSKKKTAESVKVDVFLLAKLSSVWQENTPSRFKVLHNDSTAGDGTTKNGYLLSAGRYCANAIERHIMLMIAVTMNSTCT